MRLENGEEKELNNGRREGNPFYWYLKKVQ
jgi:hypothetical protein